ncbi:ABC transporter permease [Actinomadura sp. WMMA1423]|uniref:ABC transporter permease n=1 Tax=Actinomadura sp. WMMA1423 TaxID=2591108 RepID=UPI00197A9591|nr:ABC transporter permease subunit [Actinomadura sp. WMMA1423]
MSLTATQARALPSRRPARLLAMVVPPTLVLAAFVGLWYLMSYKLLAPERRFLVPPPHRVISVGFLSGENLRVLLDGLLVTTRVAVVGLAAAIIIGLAVAIAMSQAVWAERSLYPYAVTLQTIPILALVPLFGFWFGFGFFSRVVVCTMISLFPIIANSLFGLKSVDPALRELFALQRVGRWRRLWRLDFPFALTAIFAGFRISAGLSVIGAIVGDFFFRQGTTGIGILMSLYIARLQSELLYASIILSALLGIAAFWLFSGLSFIVGKRFDRSRV